MFRVIFFWSTAAGILMAAGLMPVPSAKAVSGLAIPEISIGEQPSLLNDLGNFAMDLPVIGKTIEERVTRAQPDVIAQAPQVIDAASHTTADEQTLQVNGTGVVNFDFDIADIDDQAKARLRGFALWLADNPRVKINVFGHTDLVGTTEYNKDLGQRRADIVAVFMVTVGLEADRINSVISFGESDPVIQTEGRSRANRRVEIEVAEIL